MKGHSRRAGGWQDGGVADLECPFSCDVCKHTAAPADAKTRESAEPQLLVANTKTERREVSRGSALVSQH